MQARHDNSEARNQRFGGLFTGSYRVTLIEYPIRGKVGPKACIGQLIVNNADGSTNAILDLTVNSFLPVLALVIKAVRLAALDSELLRFSTKQWLLNYVRVKRIELDEVFGVFAECFFSDNNANCLDTKSPAYGDYFRSVRKKLEDYGIYDLIPGSLRQGPYLNTPPGNVRHIPRFSTSMKLDLGIPE